MTLHQFVGIGTAQAIMQMTQKSFWCNINSKTTTDRLQC